MTAPRSDIRSATQDRSAVPVGAWHVDPARSHASFAARVAGKSVRGRLPLIGTVNVAASIEESIAHLVALANEVSTGNHMLDRLLAGPGFLDIEDYPTLLRDASPASKIVAMLRETEFAKATVKEIAKETKIPASTVKMHLLKMDGQRVKRVMGANGLGGGRGHAAEWALLAQSVGKSVGPLSKGEPNGFSPLRVETVDDKPLETVGAQRFRGNDDDPLPF